jgi:single-stranded-DNA-specific exonuclease
MSTITTKKWLLPDKVSSAVLRQYKDLNPILAEVLHNRGFDDPQKAHHFLYDHDLKEHLEAFLLKGMKEAIKRICQAIDKKEKIVVYGDFDADGVTSSTLMMQALQLLGANAELYIPNRVDEGYGLNSPALLEIAKWGVTLVITVDCGIRSVQEVEDAKAVGLDIIITDHHSVGDDIPDALAVINPQQVDCGGHEKYKYLAGCGVAFMVAVALFQYKKPPRNFRMSDLLDLVAIGTVADIMSLNDPINRLLVKHGLKTINEGRRLGITVLAQVAGLKMGHITAQDIGFGFGPRINAAGRLGDAKIAYQLLSASKETDAKQHADQLQKLNVERQKLTRESQERIRYAIEHNGDNHEYLIFAQDDHVLAGIVGLVAGRLTEEFYRPTVILEHGEIESRASCRSIPEFHITSALDYCGDLLLRHGGHGMAAGFTVLNTNLQMLKLKLREKATEALQGKNLAPTLKIDKELRLRELTVQLAEELSVLEPTGHKNSPPLFVTRNLEIVEKKHIGSDKSHLRLKLKGDNQPPIDAIAFGFGSRADDLPSCIDVAYYLEINEYQGRRNLQMRVEDIQPATG